MRHGLFFESFDGTREKLQYLGLAIVATFWNWRHLLVGMVQPVQVLMDYANLQYYWYPQKINWRVA